MPADLRWQDDQLHYSGKRRVIPFNKEPSVPVVINNGLIETTKSPKEEHGYGLITVKHILNQLNAEYSIHYENGYFQFAAEIPTGSQ